MLSSIPGPFPLDVVNEAPVDVEFDNRTIAVVEPDGSKRWDREFSEYGDFVDFTAAERPFVVDGVVLISKTFESSQGSYLDGIVAGWDLETGELKWAAPVAGRPELLARSHGLLAVDVAGYVEPACVGG